MGQRSLRRLRTGFALVASLALFAGCQSSGGGNTTSGGGSTTSGDLSGQSATFVTFGGKEDPFFRQAFGQPVASRTGLDITYTSPTDYPKLRTQVETGNVDWTVVMGDAWWSMKNCGTLLAPRPKGVDVSNIDPKYQVDQCGVAGDTWTYNLMYDASMFKSDPPTSWADFFDTTKYPGKRGIWGNYVVNGALEAALLADGVPQDQLYPLDLDRAFAKLDTIKSDISFFNSQAQGEELMASKEVSMIITVNSSGYHLDTAGEDWAPVWDQALESWDYWIAPKGANMAAATAIMNQIASPQAQSQLDSKTPNGWTVKKIDPQPQFSPVLRAWQPAAQENTLNLIPLDQQWWADNYAAVNDRWTQWVSG